MHVRLAVTTDIETLTRFDEAAHRDQRRVDLIAASVRSEQCLVCESDGAVIGYGVLDYTWYDCGFVRMLYVHPGHRRRSVGTTLIRAMEERCRTPKLFTSTNESNAPMRALLSELGYVESGVIENLDPGDPEIVYLKEPGTNAKY